MPTIQSIPIWYKSSPLGPIPSDWRYLRMKDISTISSWTTPLRSDISFYKDGFIPWVKTTDLTNGIIIHTEEKITDLAFQKTSLKKYPEGTILVAMYGWFNQIWRTGILGIEATTNQAISAIHVDKNRILPKFLLYWLNAKVWLWKQLAWSSRKDPNITSKDVWDFPFIEIDLEEQAAIVNLFSTWDEAISKVSKLIELNNEKKKGLIQKLLTWKIRLSWYHDEVKLHPVWKYLKEISERYRDTKWMKVLSVTNSRGFIDQADQFDRSVASQDTSNYKIVRKWQFAYNPSRVNVGSLDLLRNFESGILSPMYVVFEVDKIFLIPKFFFYQLKSHWFTWRIPMYVQGSVRDSLSFDWLCGMKFFIPSLEEQSSIVDILEKSDQEIQLLRSKLEKLKEQKKWLMQQLLTGKKRLKF